MQSWFLFGAGLAVCSYWPWRVEAIVAVRLHARDGERAHVSVNGKECWRKTFHESWEGTQVCGVSRWKDEASPVTGCTGALSSAGPLTVRVWTSLNEEATNESFGIDNVVVTHAGAKSKPGATQTP